MNLLLQNAEEGLPGKYRKCSIVAEGRDRGQPRFEDVHPLMKKCFEQTMFQEDGEHLVEFLALIHLEFQYIHPGNVHFGRLLMNLHLKKHGYPILVLSALMNSMLIIRSRKGIKAIILPFTRFFGRGCFYCL